MEIPFTAVNGKIDVSVWMVGGRLLCRGWISRGVSELGMAAMCGLRVRAAGGILVLHLLGPLLLPDEESVGFLVVGGFLWGCH